MHTQQRTKPSSEQKNGEWLLAHLASIVMSFTASCFIWLVISFVINRALTLEIIPDLIFTYTLTLTLTHMHISVPLYLAFACKSRFCTYSVRVANCCKKSGGREAMHQHHSRKEKLILNCRKRSRRRRRTGTARVREVERAKE